MTERQPFYHLLNPETSQFLNQFLRQMQQKNNSQASSMRDRDSTIKTVGVGAPNPEAVATIHESNKERQSKLAERKTFLLRFADLITDVTSSPSGETEIPKWLALELFAFSGLKTQMIVSQLKDELGRSINYSQSDIARIGDVYRILNGRQLAVRVSFGELDAQTQIIKPTKEPTSYALVTAKHFTKQT